MEIWIIDDKTEERGENERSEWNITNLYGLTTRNNVDLTTLHEIYMFFSSTSTSRGDPGGTPYIGLYGEVPPERGK